ncbi:helix-turn-helix domain-containing protein [Rhodococcus sp. 114MFTsu3.1]|uniref:helix-turn-helix domain-containing protein n=1 Tax=Rhodococcus sp. 114MFTsu3.1 TaxID=1172184 RepID=UPI0012DE0DC6
MNGHVVLDGASAELVAQALDVLDTKQQGRHLSPELELIRRAIRDSATGADASSNARTPVVQWITDSSVVHCEDELLDSAAAARLLGISPNGLRDLRRRGRLAGVLHGGRWAFRRSVVEQFRASRTR